MQTRELDSPPGTLGLYARAALPMVPGASRLPFVGGRGSEIPELELVLRDAPVDRANLDAYCKVCGFAVRDELPPTYPHILAFPLHMALLTDSRFPFGPVGLVHIANRITQHRPVRRDERLAFRVYATKLEAHPKGRRFDIVTEASAGDEVVWEEASTTLRRGGGEGEGSDGGAPEPPATVAQWRVGGDVGRRYAAVSGDRNPIHMHDLSAKLFGFPRAIAHGMWTKARCLAALENRLPEAHTSEVRFRRPLLLPATVAFGSAREDGGIRFAVTDAKKGTPHLDGSVAPPARRR